MLDVAAADERRSAGGAELAAGHRQDAAHPARATEELPPRREQGQLRALQAAHRPRRLHRARGSLHLGQLHLPQERGTGERVGQGVYSGTVVSNIMASSL